MALHERVTPSKDAQRIIQGYYLYIKNNPQIKHNPPQKGVWYMGICSFEDLKINFTQTSKRSGNLNFLLVFIDSLLA